MPVVSVQRSRSFSTNSSGRQQCQRRAEPQESPFQSDGDDEGFEDAVDHDDENVASIANVVDPDVLSMKRQRSFSMPLFVENILCNSNNNNARNHKGEVVDEENLVKSTKDDACPESPTEYEPEEEKQTCIICFGGFSKKRPGIPIPCQGNCNSAPVHAKCIFEWKETKRSTYSNAPSGCPLCRGPLKEINYIPPDPLNTSSLVMFGCRKSFVTRPLPRKAGSVRCYMKVLRDGRNTRYEMYLQAPVPVRYPGGPLPSTDSPRPGDRLLMVARRSTNHIGLGSVLDMTLDETGRDFDRKGVHFVGCVKSSFTGLEHSIHAPYVTDKTLGSNGNNGGKLSYIEIAAVKYTQNRIGRSVGPRRMQVCVPRVQQDVVEAFHSVPSTPTSSTSESSPMQAFPEAFPVTTPTVDVDSDDEDDEEEQTKWSTCVHRPVKSSNTMKQKLRKNSSSDILGNNNNENDQLLFGYNKQPYWLDSIQAYSLDFSGRVTLPSNKNFQLVLEGTPCTNVLIPTPRPLSQNISLQFGKVEEGTTEVYTLDVQWPLSPAQAFGICLTACIQKYACA